MSGAKIVEGVREAINVARGGAAVIHRFYRPAWRPIRTAPKDGRWIIIYSTDLELPVSIGAYYREEERDERGRFIGGGWTGADIDGLPSGYLNPTHWMPLPDPPSEENTTATRGESGDLGATGADNADGA